MYAEFATRHDLTAQYAQCCRYRMNNNAFYDTDRLQRCTHGTGTRPFQVNPVRRQVVALGVVGEARCRSAAIDACRGRRHGGAIAVRHAGGGGAAAGGGGAQGVERSAPQVTRASRAREPSAAGEARTARGPLRDGRAHLKLRPELLLRST